MDCNFWSSGQAAAVSREDSSSLFAPPVEAVFGGGANGINHPTDLLPPDFLCKTACLPAALLTCKMLLRHHAEIRVGDITPLILSARTYNNSTRGWGNWFISDSPEGLPSRRPSPI